mgnify:CR=1 FL=1
MRGTLLNAFKVCTTMGNPAMSAKGLLGKRVEASRAGTKTVKEGVMSESVAKLDQRCSWLERL